MIVAFHGFMGSGLDFTPLSIQLSADVQAPDLIGHGTNHSMVPEEYSTATQVEYWRQRIPKGSILMGYSMGGRLALQLATQYPEHCSGLIIIGGTPGLIDMEARSKRIQWDAQQAHLLQKNGMRDFIEYWQALPIISTQSNIPVEIRTSMVKRRLQQDPSMLALSMCQFGTGIMPDCWGALVQLRIPTLLMVGELDLKYQRIAEQMMRYVPDARLLTVPKAGHCAHLENLEWSSVAIQHFVSGILS